MFGVNVSVLEVVILTISLGELLFSPGVAINCYKCKSEDSKACNSKTPAGEAIPAINCSNPNKMLNDWVRSHEFMKAGFGNVNIENMYTAGEGETAKGTELKHVTACAYLFASSENKATAEIDKGVQKARGLFGDDKADEGLTVQKWAMRDCVTITAREEAKNETNRCVPVPGTSDIAKLQFCTCTEDKCNYPNENIQGFIAESTKSTGGKFGGGGGGLITPACTTLMVMGIFTK